MPAIKLENIRHVFQTTTGTVRRRSREVVALDDVSLEIEEGEMFGFLGPNGAGKTTTIKLLTTLLIPTSGRARVMGLDAVKDAKSLRSQIGFLLGGERGLYYRLTGRENLRYFAVLYHLEPRRAKSRVEELLELVGLKDRAEERVAGYSRGMKQRLHIARMLLHDPHILFLDEPTMGLDPVGARELRDLLHRLHTEEKRTVLLTTHYMFEADALCQRIAILDQGRVVAQGTPESLKDLVSDLSVVELEVFGAGPECLDRLRELEAVDSVVVEQQELRQLVRVQTRLGAAAVPRLVASLDGLAVGRISVRESTLEDAYVRLVGRTE
jgi:ABC-2 type transport system ATP-binding protein